MATKRMVVVRLGISLTVSIPDKVPADRTVEFAYKKIKQDLEKLVSDGKAYTNFKIDVDPKIKPLLG